MEKSLKEIKFKEFINLQNQLNSLVKQIDKIPYIDIEKPIQYGYEIFIDFRDDIKNQENFISLFEACALCFKSIKVKHKAQAKKICLNPVKFKRLAFFENYPEIKHISKSIFDDLSPSLKKYFKEEKIIKNNKEFVVYICNIQTYKLVYKFKKNFIKRIKQIPEEFLNEEKQLRNKIWFSEEYKKFWKTKSKKKWKIIYSQNYRHNFVNKLNTVLKSNIDLADLDDISLISDSQKKTIIYDLF